ncbi:MAG TPA: TonB-dependent receptor plug domain-containing protein, partial [Trinickia sp.]|nr:TonB-dependent receptor plug domain-containing protein [Trinickia sp.]
MFNRTPLAAALALAFAIPFAAPAKAQSAPQTTSQSPTTPAASDGSTLPAVVVSGQPDADTQDFQAERSTVGAKTPQALRDIPQTVTVINQAVLESQGATSFQDALRNAPGITIGGAEGGQIGNN